MDKLTASQCISLIIGEMEAVRKAKGDNVTYKFRNIDQVMDAINPYLAKHGLSMNTEIVSFTAGHFDTVKKGYNNAPDTIVKKTTGTVHVRIKFIKEFYDAGVIVRTEVVMEGVAHSDDSGDKALTQAQSLAMKYALIFGFCMKSDDPDPDDKGDNKKPTPPVNTPPPNTPPSNTPPPQNPWQEKKYDDFKQIIINAAVIKSQKDAEKYVLKKTDAGGKSGVYCLASAEQVKEYFTLHEQTMKELNIINPL